MPNLANLFNHGLLICLLIWPLSSLAGNFAAKVRYAELVESPEAYSVDAKIDYQLSPTAREALQKGVPLSWDVLIQIRQPGLLRNSVLYSTKLSYTLQFHALLNQYEIKSPSGETEMFLTLNAALNYMALLHDATRFDIGLLKAGYGYQLAIKTEFNRERLPVPLRPVAYLDAQWFLSSDWFIWPIQK
ncbi:MAG: DUF4390 domain-containing protein [Methylococcaceae bacterium]|nr:DUF4390 domain-containing protein [Methylococcaceae bacterium]